MATPRWTLQRQNSNAENYHLAPVNNSNPADINFSSGIILEPGGEVVLPGKGNLRIGDEINYLKSSVANGKYAIASAISGKGIPSSGGEDFNSLASKINSIQVGGAGLSETFERSLNYPYRSGTSFSSNWGEFPDVTVYSYDNGDSTNAGDYYTLVFQQTFSFKPSSFRILASVSDVSDWRGSGFSSVRVVQIAANGMTYYTYVESGGGGNELDYGNGVNQDVSRGGILYGNLLAPIYGAKVVGNVATFAIICPRKYLDCPNAYIRILGVQ